MREFDSVWQSDHQNSFLKEKENYLLQLQDCTTGSPANYSVCKDKINLQINNSVFKDRSIYKQLQWV